MKRYGYSYAEREKVKKIVANIPKVRRVVNALTIGKPVSATQAIYDAWITTKIRSKMLVTDNINPKAIKVLTENGEVYFMGRANRKQADILVAIAQHTYGVNRIVKLLEVRTES